MIPAPGPYGVEGTRIYAADGEEVAVATRASPRHRGSAEATARLLAASWDIREALAWALQHVRYGGPGGPEAEDWCRRYNECCRLRDVPSAAGEPPRPRART